MCGRFTLKTPPAELVEIFQLLRTPELEPRYNIAPTQSVAAIRVAPEGSGRELSLLHWGLVPSWSKDPRMGSRMINARAESLAEKPAFRTAFRRRRCLIPADGFYEWKKLGTRKQPYLMTRRDGEPFALAGLWESWRGSDGSTLESCAIVTGAPNALLAEIHDRMPVILEEADYDRWLDPRLQDPAELEPLLVPYPSELLQAVPVSPLVNSPRNDTAECVLPLENPA